MSEPIKIVLLAETEQAAKSLRDFLNTANPGLRQLAIGAKDATGHLTNSRLAMMELGHVGRAMAEGLAAGISPMRMLAMETPRLAQAASMSGISLNTIKTALMGINPIVLGAAGGFAALAGAAGLLWYTFHSEEQKAIEAHNEYVKTLQSMPEVIQHINDAAKAGFLSPETQKKLLVSIGAVRQEVGKIDLKQLLTFQPGSQNFSTNALPNPNQHITLFGLPAKEDIKSVNEELVQAGFLLKQIDKDGNATYSASPKGEAIIKITELRQKLTLESVSGYEKERAAAKQSYDEQLDALNTYIQNANSALKEGEAEKLRSDLLSAYNHQITDIEFRQREEDEKKAAAAFVEGQHLMAEMVRKENDDLEHELNSSAIQQGKTREQIYEEEYKKRINMLIGQLYQGLISNDEYTKAVQAASDKRKESYDHEQEALLRVYQEQTRIAQEGIRERAGTLLSNGEIDNATKAKELAELATETQMLLLQNNVKLAGAKTDQERLTLQREQNGLLAQYGELIRHQAQLAPTLGQSMRSAIAQLKNQWGSLAIQVKQTFIDIYQTMTGSISSALTGLIERTKTWGQALNEIGTSILNSVISAIVKMFVTWIVNMTVLRLLQAIFGKESNQEAQQSASAWAPAAVAASIASYGAAAAVGTASAIAGMAIGAAVGASLSGYAEGGYTGDGGRLEPAGIVHRGEFVMDADKTQRFRPLLEDMHQGRDPIAYGRSSRTSRKDDQPKIELHAHIWSDYDKMIREIRDNSNFANVVIDVVNRRSYMIQKRA